MWHARFVRSEHCRCVVFPNPLWWHEMVKKTRRKSIHLLPTLAQFRRQTAAHSLRWHWRALHSMTDRITINAGGRVFETTTTTLKASGSHYFAALFGTTGATLTGTRCSDEQTNANAALGGVHWVVTYLTGLAGIGRATFRRRFTTATSH